MRLELAPMSWFSWDFRVLQNGSLLANIDVSSWREKGVLAVGGSNYKVYREGLMSGRFILEGNGTEMAFAEKPSALRRSFTVQHDGRTYVLQAESAFKRTFVLLEQGEQIGSIVPAGMFTRKATVNLPDVLPLPVQVFLIWLTVILWKRDSDGAVAASASTG
jgi:hypothetical protein